MSVQHVRIAQSTATEARQAVQEFHAQLALPDSDLVVFFCSSKYDLDVLAMEMRSLFAGVQVVGCTTAGEFGPSGYCQHSLSGFGFPAGSCTAVSGLLENLNTFDIANGRSFTKDLLQRLETKAAVVNPSNSFALLLVDGMSVREESVTYAFQNALGKIGLFGGSAGDDLKFDKTYVFSDGSFHTDSAVLALINTPFPFKIFKTEHFVSSQERLVVTEADPAKRIVREINGLPAASEYARIVGVDVSELNPMLFAASPFVVKVAGTDYVRSVQKVNADGSLTFFCAIDEGLVLRVGHGVDLVGTLEQSFDRIRAEIGAPQLIIGCDCILRNIEASQKGWKVHLGEIFRRNNTIGFSCYGEQFHDVHVNQTFAGCAIGAIPEPDAEENRD